MSQSSSRAELVSLLRKIANGDRAALRALYERTSAKLFGICVRVLPDREEAEDVLQEVYLTIWNKAGSFDPSRASPITWLATIARNRAIDRLRSLGARGHGRPIEDADQIGDDSPDPLAGLQHAQETERLHDCLKSLDQRARISIGAAYFGGLTYQELANRAAMPLGTIKSVIRRALIKLKGCLES
ncbi:sigma-70 family RNA polymerase sigma factor [Consotaella aegiceratis]|uniref:sigma-70 family RNA polymerase sigma factor n=1 Tax=Consotaella aegiceratis TaxID=3097961 RepID=UPI002F3FAADF